ILLTLFACRTLSTLLFFTFSGMVALLLSSRIHKRVHLLLPSLGVGLVNTVLVFAFATDFAKVASHLDNMPAASATLQSMFVAGNGFASLAWGFMGGLLAAPLAILLLPVMEMSWHISSTFKLTRYADLQQPLMKDLLSRTPATYQHSMTVAFLSQAVGEAIGANTQLLRIGAYYHDIGKMADPKFFAENQAAGKNPHDDLDPYESARIIIGHVHHGEEFAREAKLPQLVIDFISQHHGTQLVEYFYDKAMKNSQGTKPRKEDFRYPGPKPQSIEAAILMIVDAVEATSRSLEEPTREKIEKMVVLTVIKRLADGQFDECNLSTRDLGKVIHTLVDSLEASLHSRVQYPWQERKKNSTRRAS
ncbi:MAG: HDIG domain-containing protein, partial [Deltaproteobacteria bacterium]|nr:HDIG domain-containing protein [Deltaproteobacteria bacterium]